MRADSAQCIANGTLPAPVAISLNESLRFHNRGFATADYSVACDFIQRSSSGKFALSLRKADEFRSCDFRSVRLADVQFSLLNVDSSAGYCIDMAQDPDVVLLHFLIKGSARLQQGSFAIEGQPSQLVLLEAVARTQKEWCGSTKLLMIKVSRKHLEQIIISETGLAIENSLNFGVMQVVDFAHVPTLLNHVINVCNDLNGPNPCFQGHLGRLAERVLLLLLLKAIPNNYRIAFTADKGRCAAPFYVRRVEKFLLENAHKQISLSDLVSASGVSLRSIHQGFQKFRSTTPMNYLKAIRLDRARDALRQKAGTDSANVTDVAFNVGYTNLSQFSRDYRARFRESPSATLIGF